MVVILKGPHQNQRNNKRHGTNIWKRSHITKDRVLEIKNEEH